MGIARDLDTVRKSGLPDGTFCPCPLGTSPQADEKRLEELRALNRATKDATGEYMS